jgi:hypothetical protein
LVLAASIATLLAVSEPAKSCIRGFGVLYDELHSFRVTAPSGWCCDPRTYSCAVSRHPAANEVLSLSFAYASAGVTFESWQKEQIGSAPSDLATALPDMITADGRRAKVWKVHSPPARDELMAFLLQENVCMVRLSLRASGTALSPEGERAFMKFVSSYSGFP